MSTKIMRKLLYVITIMILALCMCLGCGGKTDASGNASGDTSETASGDTDSALADGTYQVGVTLEGGTGKAGLQSPCEIVVEDGICTAKLVWSSTHYDYMIVDDVKYTNENVGGNSTFHVVIGDPMQDVPVTADTTAMSTPHEIEYKIHFAFNDESSDHSDSSSQNKVQNVALRADGIQSQSDILRSVDFHDLTLTREISLDYAEQFTAAEYGDCTLLTIGDDQEFLLAPKGLEVTNVPSEITVLNVPLENIYLVSTSAMDLVVSAGALSSIRFSGTSQEDWYIESASEAMADGKMIYAGKYSAPDYEKLLGEGCTLAIENTMIYHNPEVMEKLQELGIPVMVERSSYESHPLGRLEWIKMYGMLFGREKEAEDFYESQKRIAASVMENAPSGQTCAFFYVNSQGVINVRRPGDYVSEMIRLSGGTYVPDFDIGKEESVLSTMNMQMEDFYAAAKDADILIYNSSIDEELNDMNDLIGKNQLFADFKAVKNGNVYCCGKNFFQESSHMAEFMEELSHILKGEPWADAYLHKLQGE